MKQLMKISLVGLLTLSLAGVFSACDEEEQLGTPDRLFRPVVKETSYSGTWIRMEWDRYEGAETFQLQLSVDSFATVLSEVETDTTFYLFEDLDYDTEYQIRVRSIGTLLSSEFFVAENITTSDYPTKLVSPGAEDVIDNRARIRWEEAVYDSLRVFRNDTLQFTMALSEAENTAGQVVLRGLVPEQPYIVRAYADGEYMGKKAFATLAPEVFEGAVVDLREYSNEESYSLLKADSVAVWEALYPEGYTVVLAGGATYSIDTGIEFATNVRFVTGLSLDGFARFAISSNFDAAAGAQLDYLRFEKVVFTEHVDKPKEGDHFGATYVFNFGTGGANVGELVFENCDIRYKRGVIRMKSPTTLGRFVMNNCVVDSISGYGVLNLDNSEVVCGDVVVSNSTIGHAQKFIVARKAISLESVTLENVTTYHTPNGSGDYFLDLENKSVPGGVLVKNSLFGPAWTSEIARGIRSMDAPVTVEKSYRTSDLKWGLDENNNLIYPLDLTDSGKTSVETFADVDNNDFTLIDKSLSGSVGDPRWW